MGARGARGKLLGTGDPGESAYAEGLALFTEEADLTPIIRNLKARDRTSF